MTVKDPVLTIGSCFADMLGTQLKKNKFIISNNPFGTLYNPLSIHKAFRYAIFNELPADHTYLQHHDVFANYDFHSMFSDLQRKPVEDKIKETIGFNHYFLKDCRFLIVTYGTAMVYERNDTKEVVANCHKVPAHHFKKHLLTPDDITKSFDSFYSELQAFNPNIKIILTVSPVRHLKETLELNSVSKSILRLACHMLSETHVDVSYFPSYEIMLDDLRDYRFYASDMIHPSADAEKYIWEKFTEKYFDNELLDFLEKWSKVQSALSHKPFHPQSVAHQHFLKDTLSLLKDLKSMVNVDTEINFIQRQLTNP